MNITIKKLNPELTEDYLRFFDETPHSTGKSEHKCYCVCWASTDGDSAECATAQMRRAVAQKYITNQYLQGYLAYHDGKVVGWCNANNKSECYDCIAWKMFLGDVRSENLKVKSVFCFAIHPEYRRMGVAKMLLKRVCEDAEIDGFDCVEAYPNTDYVGEEQDYMGPSDMFEKAGFVLSYTVNHKSVMIRTL